MRTRILMVVGVLAVLAAACSANGYSIVGGDNAGGDDPYVGKSVSDAGAYADAHGVTWRVVMEDGVGLAVTMDYQPDRMNFTVESGVVVEAVTDAGMTEGNQGIDVGEPYGPSAGYVGLTLEDAGALADSNGVPWRVVREDGEDLMITMDYRPDRVNFTVEAGVVVAAATDAEIAGE